jgi:hypothetical protein
MDVQLIYLYTLVNTVILLAGLRLCNIHIKHLSNLLRRYLLYPNPLPYIRIFRSITRLELIIQLIYWCGNSACNIIGVHSSKDARIRAGVLALINLLPLLAIPLELPAQVLGLSRRCYIRIHRAIAIMTLAQSIAHIIFTLTHNNTFSFKDAIQFTGFLVQ